MSRLTISLCMLATLAVGIAALGLLADPPTQSFSAVDTAEGAAAAPVLENMPLATTSPETATTTAPSTPQKKSPPQKKAATPAKAEISNPAPPPTPPPPSPDPAPEHDANERSLDAASSLLRNALVNILCRAPAGSKINSTSGSGIFIDSKGIILTNAHIAQYFLLADRGVSCTIRTGGPALDTYKASPIYISPTWIQKNSTVLIQDSPSGNGRYDFALLAVTQSANVSRPLPSVFPSIRLATQPVASGTPVVIASYGAQFIGSEQITSALFPTVVFGSVKDVFTFERNTIDLLALGGSAAAQEGSSGGGVADESGKLIGTITTSTITGETSARSLNALTGSYIRGEYASETGQALDLLLALPIAESVADFAARIPELAAIITANLP